MFRYSTEFDGCSSNAFSAEIVGILYGHGASSSWVGGRFNTLRLSCLQSVTVLNSIACDVIPHRIFGRKISRFGDLF